MYSGSGLGSISPVVSSELPTFVEASSTVATSELSSTGSYGIAALSFFVETGRSTSIPSFAS